MGVGAGGRGVDGFDVNGFALGGGGQRMRRTLDWTSARVAVTPRRASSVIPDHLEKWNVNEGLGLA